MPTFKSVKLPASDSQNEYYPVVMPFKVNYVNPVLPKLKTFESLVKSYQDRVHGEDTPKLKVEKIRQNIHEQISQKIEKKLEDVKLEGQGRQ